MILPPDSNNPPPLVGQFPVSFAFTASNIIGLPIIERLPITNQVTYRLDYESSEFKTELTFIDAPSVQRYGLAGQDIIESKGLRTAHGGAGLAALTARRIFERFGGIDPVTGASVGGAVTYTVSSFLLTLGVEVGDFVSISHPLLLDTVRGVRGVSGRICEVISKQPQYDQGNMQYKLLDLAYLGTKQLSLVAPDGTPAWTGATDGERTAYMFVASDETGAYSDGTPGKLIW